MQIAFRYFNKTQFSQRLTSLFSSPLLLWVIICFGILVRLVQYFYNRSLWADEAVLALNIVNRTYLELLQPLDYEQGAPLGFLMVEKLAVQVFGNSEYALRLFPLLSGIVSLLLFYVLAKRCIPRLAMPIALALFASLPHLIYYASEVKQYSTDVMIALLSCLVAMQLRRPKLNPAQTVTISIVGAIAIWFSHPAVFVLAGVGTASLLVCITRRETRIISKLGVCFTWILSFTIFYFVSIRSLGSSKELLQSWQRKGAFPSSPFDIIWVFDSLGKFFHNPLGFTGLLDGLAILVFIIGCISCFYRRKEVLFILLFPVFVTLFAAYLHKYPFGNRLVLFLTPFIILLIAEGAEYLLLKTRSKSIAIISVLSIVLLLAPPLLNASTRLVKPYLKEEIKPVISYVKNHQQPGDVLYIYQRGEYQFKYYASRYGYREGDYIIGVDDLDKFDGKRVSVEEWKRYKKDLDNLRGNKRVWLIFSHANITAENEMIKSYLDSIGNKIDEFHSIVAFVYLYDLT